MSTTRSFPIDLLRGSAIILVLFRHHPLTRFTENMGWIGVDLFFVLSGFLISGLLFKEYDRFGNIKPVHFLIRRGFKIYPLFYGLLPVLVWMRIWKGQFHWVGLFSELVFLQNYLFGFGWWDVSWSLAIEEHFYFALTIALFMASKRGGFRKSMFPKIVLCLMLLCLAGRLAHCAYLVHAYPVTNHQMIGLACVMTHWRFDSLLCGVLIAWAHNYHRVWLKAQADRWKRVIPILVLALLSFSPFMLPYDSWFIATIGFTMLYIAFGLLLIHLLFNLHLPHPNALLRSIGKIGQWSYAIYLSHVFIFEGFLDLPGPLHLLKDHLTLRFVTYFLLSITLGAALSLTWERWFLNLRERWFPARHTG